LTLRVEKPRQELPAVGGDGGEPAEGAAIGIYEPPHVNYIGPNLLTTLELRALVAGKTAYSRQFVKICNN
jgi:hypothetical protein